MQRQLSRWQMMLLGAASLLLLPLVAMCFSQEVHWTFLDFSVAGFLLFSVCSSLEVVLRTVHLQIQKWLWVGAIILIFGLLWLELAVGILGTAIAGS